MDAATRHQPTPDHTPKRRERRISALNFSRAPVAAPQFRRAKAYSGPSSPLRLRPCLRRATRTRAAQHCPTTNKRANTRQTFPSIYQSCSFPTIYVASRQGWKPCRHDFRRQGRAPRHSTDATRVPMGGSGRDGPPRGFHVWGVPCICAPQTSVRFGHFCRFRHFCCFVGVQSGNMRASVRFPWRHMKCPEGRAAALLAAEEGGE